MVVNVTSVINSWTLSDEDLSLSDGLDSSNPNDDIWRKFALPLTPPCSPRSFGESSDGEEVNDRLQDMSDNLDASYDVRHEGCSRADFLHSKLISDCMWSGLYHDKDIFKRSHLVIHKSDNQKKLIIENEESLYPTPCPSPPPSAIETSENLLSNECVDPTSVFPFSPINESSSTSQSDTDEEIDVVTVDAKPLKIEIGAKRKLHTFGKTNIILAKIQTEPTLHRTKSAPVKDNRTSATLSRRSYCSSSGDESDPHTRRANHNVLERQRRIDLKKSFERLRDCIPNIESNYKAPKVIVLKKATEFVTRLNHEEKSLMQLRKDLELKNKLLRERLLRLGGKI